VLFEGGVGDINQLYKIFQIMGKPNEESWPGVRRWMNSSFEGVEFEESEGVAIEEMMGGQEVEDEAVELLYYMLMVNPQQRITARKA